MPLLRFLVLALAAASFACIVLGVRRWVKREAASPLGAFGAGGLLAGLALAVWWWGLAPR